MKTQRSQEVKKILELALEREGRDREAYLNEVCAEASVRRQVESLIAAHDQTHSSFLPVPADTREGAAIGDRLGSYEILSRISAGGMGAVYCALDTKLGRRVAVKVLPPEMARDPRTLARFQREARSLAALDHPNIVTVHSIEEVDGIHFLTMELVEGKSLGQLIAERGLLLDRIVGTVTAIAEALAAAHEKGIVHRDLKPANVMVTNEGRVKVLDFGLAKEIHIPNAIDSTLTVAGSTNPGVIVGTPSYMSPEQTRGESLTAVSDVFSLGIVSYKLITGRHPFQADSTVGFLHSIASREPIPPSRLVPEIPAWFETLVLRMLEKQPGRRCTAADVVLAFHQQDATTQKATSQAVASPRRVVGRKKELAELEARFESAVKGEGSIVCVSGEPGQGKTTLVEEFLIGLMSRSKALVARCRCSERLAGAEAYLPLMDALDSLLNGAERELVVAVMKSLAPTWHALLAPVAATARQTGAPSQEKLKREIAAVLEEISRQQPLVIFLDDVHWADLSTVDLLSYLGTRLDRICALILVSYRVAELRSSNHSFLKLQLELQARGICREMTLRFLERDEIQEYIDLEFPSHRFPSELSRMIHKRTEGNPLFVVDLLRYLRERQRIVLQDGNWVLADSITEILSDLPQSIRSMVQRKIEQLSENDRSLLLAASVQGSDFDSAVLAKAMDADPADIEEALDILEGKSEFVRFIGEHEYPNRDLTLRYRFVHLLYQNAFYGALRPTRRSSLSKLVGEALLHFHGAQAGKIAAQLAFLFKTARDFERAADYYQVAAENSLLLFGSHEAETLARRGLELLESLPGGETRSKRELILQKLLAGALRNLQSDSGREAGATLRRVRELSEQLQDYPTLFAVHYGLAWSHHTHQEFPRALEEAQQCLRISERLQDSALVAAAHLIEGDIMAHQGRLAESRKHLEAVDAHYDPSNAAFYVRMIGSDPGVHAKGALGLVLAEMGYLGQGKASLRESIDLARITQNPIARGVALLCTILGFKHLRDEEVLRQASDDLIDVCLKNELHGSMAYFGKFGQGWALALRGNAEDGLPMIDGAIADAQKVGLKYGVVMLAYGKAEAMQRAGRTQEMLNFLDERLAEAEQCGQLFDVPDLYRLKGDCLLQACNGADPPIAQAEECFLRAVEVARRLEAKLCELEATIDLAGLYRAHNRTVEARQMLGDLYRWFTEGFESVLLKRAKALLGELS